MKHNKRITLLSLAVLLALIVSAALPLAVFAQDEIPPADPIAVEPVPPVDEPPAQEEQSVADVPVVEEQPAVDVIVEDAPAADLTIPEVLEQLPEDTGLVVVDETGAAIPLASQEAAETVASADPFFKDMSLNGGAGGYVGYTTSTCPAQVTVCNVVSANPIQAAVDAFKANSNASGYIYIEAGNYTGNVTIDAGAIIGGGNFNNLQGLIGQGSGTTTINGDISINYLTTTAFTLQGFTLQGHLSISAPMMGGGIDTLNLTDIKQVGQNKPSEIGILYNGDGLGDVNLTDVSAENNGKLGATINFHKNLTVTGGSFGPTTDIIINGAGIYSYGASATINGATIYDNKSVGVSNGSTAALIVNCSTFSGNGTDTSSNVTVNSGGCGAKGQAYLPWPFAPVVKPPAEPVFNPPANNPPADLGGTLCKEGNLSAYCPSGFVQDNGSIIPVSASFGQNALPGSLPQGSALVAGFDITLHRGTADGERVSEATGLAITVDIPADMQGKPIRVMFWDDSAWVEVTATLSADGKQATFTVAKEGKYALVTP